ncbi:MAG: hypothetical protein ABT940_04590 [Alphaproteobacteria bacterium]
MKARSFFGNALDPQAALHLSDIDSIRIPRTVWIETLLFLGIVLVVDRLFFDGTRFFSVSPHPFWFIVIMVAVQYGTTSGLLSVVLSTLALLVGNVPAQALEQDYYAYLLSIIVAPVGWMTAALVLGELRRRQFAEEARIRQALAGATEREETLAKAYANVSQVNARLETRVAAQLKTGFTIFNAAQAVERMKTGSVLLGAEKMILELLAPSKFSFFVLNKNVLEAVYDHGWTAEDRFDHRISHDTNLFRALVTERRLLCVTNADDEFTLGGQGLLAAAVVHAGTEEILGVFKIEQMGFLDLHLTTVENFRLICEWIGSAYARAEEYETSIFSTAPSEVRYLMPMTVLEPLSKWLGNLAYRAKFDLWVMTVSFAEKSGMDSRQISNLIGQILLDYLRTTDLMFHSWKDARTLQVLLPATPSANVAIVKTKIEAAILESMPPEKGFPSVSVTLGALHQVAESGGITAS